MLLLRLERIKNTIIEIEDLTRSLDPQSAQA
jgi:hypothetical protein